MTHMRSRPFQTLRTRAATCLNVAALAGCSTALASHERAAPGVLAVTSGRFASLVASLIAITGVVMGVRAVRAVRGSVAAIVAGLIGLALGASVVANATSGIGTGSGVAGAIVAMVFGGTALVLGGIALVRSRRHAGSTGRDGT